MEGGPREVSFLVRGFNFRHTFLPWRTLWLSTRRNHFLFGPTLLPNGKGLLRGTLGFGDSGDGESSLLSFRTEAPVGWAIGNYPVGWAVGNYPHPHAHACFKRQSLLRPTTENPLSVSLNPGSHPLPSSVGPDAEKQRSSSSPAVKIPCASPLQRNTEGGIISEIISLILN